MVNNKQPLSCADCGFKKLIAIDRKDRNHYFREISIKEKLHYYLFEDCDRGLNKRKLSNLLKIQVLYHLLR